MSWMVDPETREPIRAVVPGDRSLRALLPDVDYERAPKRIQRRRTKGWRMPAGAVYVGRPTRWGNPWIVGRWNGAAVITLEVSLIQFRSWAEWSLPLAPQMWARLRGRDLVCWCPLDQPCHADVLLDLANR